MDHDVIDQLQEDAPSGSGHEPPGALLCSEARNLSQRVVSLLGSALEEHSVLVRHKLGLADSTPLSEALSQWCQRQGSTVFVLRGVLMDLGRTDLAHALVQDMQTMCLYIVLEEVGVTPDLTRRHFYTVSTRCDVTLASALVDFLHGDLDGYRIVGPDSTTSWTTLASQLKGKQLTLRRYLTSKMDRGTYGCNSYSSDTMDVKGQGEKVNRPATGISEMKGPYTMGVNNCQLSDSSNGNTPLKRAQTMPTFFNIHPEDNENQLHAIEDLKLKHLAVSPALSSESVTNNMVAMDTFNSLSATASLTNVGQGGMSWDGTTPSVTSIDYEFTLDDSTHRKVPIEPKPSAQTVCDKDDIGVEGNTDFVPIHKGEPKRESSGNIDVNMTVVTTSESPQATADVPNMSIFQESFSGNNFHHPPIRTVSSQSSSTHGQTPAQRQYQQNDLNCTARSNGDASLAAARSTVSRTDVPNPSRHTDSGPKIQNSDFGFKELNESMDFLTEESGYPQHSCVDTNDLGMSLSLDLELARGNGDSDCQRISNVYTPLSAMISPLSGAENGFSCTDSTNQYRPFPKSESESDAENKIVEDHLHNKNTDVLNYKRAIDGKSLALQEQDLKLRKLTSLPPNSQESYAITQYSSDFESTSTKRSPFVHTPPPQFHHHHPLETVPPSYLDVSCMHGQDQENNIIWQQMSHTGHPPMHYINLHGGMSEPLQAHASSGPHFFQTQNSQGRPMYLPDRSLPVHSNAFTSISQVRNVGVQTPPIMRRHNFPPPPARTPSSVSEPGPQRYRQRSTRELSTDDDDDPEEPRHNLYLTPVNDFPPSSHVPVAFNGSSPRKNAKSPRTVVDDAYNYIDIRHMRHERLPSSGGLHPPNRAPPTPPRQQMNLEDQLARIQGWCPNETDATIEATMKDFKGQNGYYIMWRSKFKNRYIITVSHKNDLLHFLIEQQRLDTNPDKSVYFLYRGGFSSESLLELVNHYISCGVKRRLNDSPIGTKAYVCEHIPLRRPLKVKSLTKQMSLGS